MHIVVATPGRFLDHFQQGNTSLSRISFVVLDEADRMLDMGFQPQIQEVLMSLPLFVFLLSYSFPRASTIIMLYCILQFHFAFKLLCLFLFLLVFSVITLKF